VLRASSGILLLIDLEAIGKREQGRNSSGKVRENELLKASLKYEAEKEHLHFYVF
jgi:hypothetical protein